MDTETKRAAYHSAPFEAVGSLVSSFGPVNAIHQHLCAFHCYSHDRGRHVEAHHFCTHLSPDFHQCVIYDSDGPDAKLIGVEYIVSEKARVIFVSLPADEKKYWHSHKYEVESGLLQLTTKSPVPGSVTAFAEQPAMLELQQTYGKTIHTWAVDATPQLPLGPPHLMMSYTRDGETDAALVKARDERTGVATEDVRQLRKGYLPEYTVQDGADGKTRIEFVTKETD